MLSRAGLNPGPGPKRVRPKMMAVMAAMMGLLPVLWSNGAGADLPGRI
jgi:Cu(I)/Ag(I) efflux system membrane protein CusA/SilA